MPLTGCPPTIWARCAAPLDAGADSKMDCGPTGPAPRSEIAARPPAACASTMISLPLFLRPHVPPTTPLKISLPFQRTACCVTPAAAAQRARVPARAARPPVHALAGTGLARGLPRPRAAGPEPGPATFWPPSPRGPMPCPHLTAHLSSLITPVGRPQPCPTMCPICHPRSFRPFFRSCLLALPSVRAAGAQRGCPRCRRETRPHTPFWPCILPWHLHRTTTHHPPILCA